MEQILIIAGIVGALLVLAGIEFVGSGLDGTFWNKLGKKMIRSGAIVIVGLIIVIVIRHWLKI